MANVKLLLLNGYYQMVTIKWFSIKWLMSNGHFQIALIY